MKRITKIIQAFTLIELLTVMAIIVALAGLVLMSAGWAQKRAARAKAEAEISALSAACESYKIDQGIYPIPRAQLSGSDAYSNPSVATFKIPSRALYQALSGDGNNALEGDGSVASDGKLDSGSTRYMEFKEKMLGGLITTTDPVGYQNAYIQDPYGYPYGYYAPNAVGTSGTTVIYNPTFDLWSTAGSTSLTGTMSWIKNW